MPVADSAAPNSKSSQLWALATLGAPTSVSTTTAYPARENIVSLLGGAPNQQTALTIARGHRDRWFRALQQVTAQTSVSAHRSSLGPAYFYLVPGSRRAAG